MKTTFPTVILMALLLSSCTSTLKPSQEAEMDDTRNWPEEGQVINRPDVVDMQDWYRQKALSNLFVCITGDPPLPKVMRKWNQFSGEIDSLMFVKALFPASRITAVTVQRTGDRIIYTFMVGIGKEAISIQIDGSYFYGIL